MKSKCERLALYKIMVNQCQSLETIMAIMKIDKDELKILILRMMDALAMTRIVWIIMMIMMMRSKMLMIMRSRLKTSG